MSIGEATYELVHSGQSLIRRLRTKTMQVPPTPYRYRIWMGKGLEPVVLVVVNRSEDITVTNRLHIRDAMVERLPDCKRFRYFEWAIASQRFVTEVYFPHRNAPLSKLPTPEMRSLAYLERVLGLTVSVV